MEILFIRLIESLLLPPGLMILMMLLGTLIIGRFFITGKTLIIGGFVLLIAASLPVVSGGLLALLERSPPITPEQLKQRHVQAIVILGGGRYATAPEYDDQDTVSRYTLERLRYGAYLHRQTGLPILVTAGSPHNEIITEAELMRRVLVNDFRVPVKWIESRSKNTWENARFTHQQLYRNGVTRIALVTHAWHMPRSVEVFEQQGFEVTPAATVYQTRSQPLLLEFVPSAHALEETRKAMHELLGRMWYAMRY